MPSSTGPAAVSTGTEFVDSRAKGKRVPTPALNADGDLLIGTGKRFRIARIRGEQVREREIEYPQRILAALQSQPGRALKSDISSFAQRDPATEARFSFPVEFERALR